jgi:hypothetical protein
MAIIYYRLILVGEKTIDQVPAHLREEVQAMLDANAAN